MFFFRVVLFCLLTSHAIAKAITFIGVESINLSSSTPESLLKQPLHSSSLSTVTLVKVKLSPQAADVFKQRAQQAVDDPKEYLFKRKLPSRVQLGMNHLPVFEQGPHGSCTTFATIAAIDALLGKGDYISPLCQLQLGRHLAHFGYGPSGWEGITGRSALHQIKTFGFINKSRQKAYGCGGLSEYPVFPGEPSTEMSLTDFHLLSEKLPLRISWSSLVDSYQAALKETDMALLLNEVKTAIKEGDRLTMGMLLMDTKFGTAGAVGQYKVTDDTWVLTTSMINNMNNNPEYYAHEVVITGYDDKAVAVDHQGRKHYGLLTLRNSWGSGIGDAGNFYVAYDYFKAMVTEVQRVRQLP